MAERLKLLEEWLTNSVGLAGFAIELASGDASFRRYFRVTLADGSTRIAMDAPPVHEDCEPFVAVAGQLERFGLNIPTIFAADTHNGFLLLKDLGSEHYLDLLSAQNVDRLYGDALGALVTLQACVPGDDLPAYDEVLLRREMALFPDWLLRQQLALELSGQEQQMLKETFDGLVANALEQPQVCVHRDYHSRNLLVASPNPGIIDFQDAVYGPVTYDLVSLLRDCYIRWPIEQVEAWALGYYELARQSGVLRSEDEAHFLRWFDLMGVQRQLKASGIFARLNQRDGKPGYLKDIPRTLGYILDVAPKYPQLAGLAALISERVMPAVEAFRES
ncbi:MAG: phosphotransferase [Chromatiales bacterium]|nr:phosphotransferase [Chromatiales bacterium]